MRCHLLMMLMELLRLKMSTVPLMWKIPMKPRIPAPYPPMRHRRHLPTAPPWHLVVTRHQQHQPHLTTLLGNTSSQIFLGSLVTSSSLRNSRSHTPTVSQLPKTAVMQLLKIQAMLHLRIVSMRLLNQLVMRHPRKTITKLQKQIVMKPQKLNLMKLQRLKLMKLQRLKRMRLQKLMVMKLLQKVVTKLQKKVVTLHLNPPHLLTWYQPLKNLRLPAQKSTLQSMKDQTQCNDCCHYTDHSCGHFCMLAASLPAGISSNS